MKGLMIAAMSSGGGKTTLTCGLLAALKARGLNLQAFKCGPDYIDPMFHTQILGVPSRNLDLFLQGEEGVRRTFARASGADLALIEGAMGFYDGLGGTERASAWAVAEALNIPVILALRPQGASLTLAAQVRGLMEFRRPSHIAGLILTSCKPSLHTHLTPILERETGLPVLGYLPPMEEARLPSRHLGLWTAGEIDDLTARFRAIGVQAEKTVDQDALLTLAAEREIPTVWEDWPEPRCTVAVARDEAFCFCYADNLDLLEQAGAKLAFFSPLHDRQLPSGADGLYLVGGYPELYARQLGENTAMRESIRQAVTAGLPTVAECGGFLYLQQTLEDDQGKAWPMAGVLPGGGFRTDRLQRFGYIQLTAQEDGLLLRAGETVPAHEFHYWDCTENGTSLTAQKPLGEKTWPCGVCTENLYAAFPHMHFGGDLPLAERFVEKAIQWRNKHE